MKNKIAFIDHSFHRKTASTAFMTDLLKTAFDVDIFWCDSWKTGRFRDLEALNLSAYRAVIFWQVMYPLRAVIPYRDRCIFIPMFDGAWRDSDLFWRKYRGFRFLNFSRILHERMTSLGIRSLYAQYFPEIHGRENQPDSSGAGPLAAFFWERSPEISWNTVKRLIKYCNIEKVYYHTAADRPGVPYGPTAEDIRRYHISFSRWFPDKRAYWSMVDRADLYFAPRTREGVGLSFLEAMARGKCVIAPDNPTMNEYIVSGITGELYNPRWPRHLIPEDMADMPQRSIAAIRDGRRIWEGRKEEILDFIRHPAGGLNDAPKNGCKIRLRSVLSSAVYRPMTLLQKKFDQFWYSLIRKGIVLK